jgi:uncharacterized membrane protein YhhN
MVAATVAAGGPSLGYASRVTAPVLVTLAALAGLLISEYREWRPGIWIFKPLASTAFIVTALAAGALDGGRYGVLVLAALVLSWWGDVLLIPHDRPAAFRAGLLAFLLGHVVYVAAFASRGFDPGYAALTFVLLAPFIVGIVRWLRAHVPADMKVPVYAYICVITVMLICGAASWPAVADPAIPLGAFMFYLSDIAVARDRFVSSGFVNASWGLPLYYIGQLVLASTAGG